MDLDNAVPSFVGEDLVWCELRRPAATRRRPALFLDRDGVLVEEVHYLHRPEDVALIAGAAEVVAAARTAELAVVMVTNQAGIARGYYGWAAFTATQAEILRALAAAGAPADGGFDLILACPFHAEGQPPFRHPDHPCRKPNPGMLLRAAEVLDLDLGGSWIVGDRAIDMAAGRAAGVAGGLQVATGHGGDDGERPAALALADGGFRIELGESIAAALSRVPLLSGAGRG